MSKSSRETFDIVVYPYIYSKQ